MTDENEYSLEEPESETGGESLAEVDLEITEVFNSVVGCAAGDNIEISQGAAVLAIGDEIHMEQSGAVVAIAEEIRIEGGGALLVIAENVEGEYTTVFTPVTAAIFGGAFALTSFLLGQIFRCRR